MKKAKDGNKEVQELSVCDAPKSKKRKILSKMQDQEKQGIQERQQNLIAQLSELNWRPETESEDARRPLEEFRSVEEFCQSWLPGLPLEVC